MEVVMRKWTLEKTQEALDVLVRLGVIEACGSDYQLTTFGQLIPPIPQDATEDELVEWVQTQRRRLAVRYAMERMAENGLIVPTGDTRNGQDVYKMTSLGEEIFNAIRSAGININLMTNDELDEFVVAYRRRVRPLVRRECLQLDLLD
jgi:hypothetical protein